MTEEEADKHDEALVRKALDMLSEHFETVRVFVSTHEKDGSRRYTKGIGNYWSNYGMIKAWLIGEEAIIKQDAINDMKEE